MKGALSMSKSVFISYATPDIEYANRIYMGLRTRGISVWYAPTSIDDGSNFADEIGNALCNEADKSEKLVDASIFVFLLSEHSMTSPWCKKEIKLAINMGKRIYVLQIDRKQLSPEFQLLLVDINYITAYHLPEAVLTELYCNILTQISLDTANRSEKRDADSILCQDIHMLHITRGDPDFLEGTTLKTKLSKLCFFLAPPLEQLSPEEQLWVKENMSFSNVDQILDSDLITIQEESGIDDLINRIQASRLKVIRDFIAHKNGCYFNNRKYGINSINPFSRSVDFSESAELIIEFYTTDYYTHRVMKDVCKILFAERHSFYTGNLSFSEIRPFRILFTSIGINLLLTDSYHGVSRNVLLTRRSVNSAETNGLSQYSISVIEGVSLSDFDPYRQMVSLNTAAERGLIEEMGISPNLLKRDNIQFNEVFVNLQNLEIGISCIIQLKEGVTFQESIISLHGKDETLEVAEKIVCPVEKLSEFLLRNRDNFMPQAIYSIGAFLNRIGINILIHSREVLCTEEIFLIGKNGNTVCGDQLLNGAYYNAIVDGVTPKSDRLWDGRPGDVFVSDYLIKQIDALPEDIDGKAALEYLNKTLRNCYGGRSIAEIEPFEMLQASVLIFSKSRREIWCYGDCQFSINGIVYENKKRVDQILSLVRSLYLETEISLGKSLNDLKDADTGRSYIMPLLKNECLFANTNHPYGYPVLCGTRIVPEFLQIVPVKYGDHIVFASDGYPKLFGTLYDSERYLEQMILKDPLCMNENCQTKGVIGINKSYDDRSYLSFVVR